MSKLVNRREYLKERPWRVVLHAHIRQTEDLFTNLRLKFKRLLAMKTGESAVDKGMRDHLRDCLKREEKCLMEEIGERPLRNRRSILRLKFEQRMAGVYGTLYEAVDYITSSYPCMIHCKKHDVDFTVKPKDFLEKGDDCPLCRRETRAEVYLFRAGPGRVKIGRSIDLNGSRVREHLVFCDKVLDILYVGEEEKACDLESSLLAAFIEHCGGPCVGRETFPITEKKAKEVWCRAVSDWENGISGRGKAHLESVKKRTKANDARTRQNRALPVRLPKPNPDFVLEVRLFSRRVVGKARRQGESQDGLRRVA